MADDRFSVHLTLSSKPSRNPSAILNRSISVPGLAPGQIDGYLEETRHAPLQQPPPPPYTAALGLEEPWRPAPAPHVPPHHFYPSMPALHSEMHYHQQQHQAYPPLLPPPMPMSAFMPPQPMHLLPPPMPQIQQQPPPPQQQPATDDVLLINNNKQHPGPIGIPGAPQTGNNNANAGMVAVMMGGFACPVCQVGVMRRRRHRWIKIIVVVLMIFLFPVGCLALICCCMPFAYYRVCTTCNQKL